MKIEYYYGCTSRSISIDNEIISGENFNKDKLIEVANIILKNMTQDMLEYQIKELIESNSTEYEDFGRCEQCGDHPGIYKIDI